LKHLCFLINGVLNKLDNLVILMNNKQKDLTERYNLVEKYERIISNMDYRSWLLKIGLHETRMISWIIDHSDDCNDDC